MHPVNGSHARQAFTSPLFWAFMLMCVLVSGVVLGFVAMRRTTQARQTPRLKPMAMLEAMVAISAGVLLAVAVGRRPPSPPAFCVRRKCWWAWGADAGPPCGGAGWSARAPRPCSTT